MIVCLPFIPMITSWPMNVASASSVPPHTIDCHQPACHESSKVKLTCHIPTFASQLTDEYSLSTRRAIHRLPPSTHPISLYHSLQSVSPNSLDHSLQARTSMACKCISTHAQSRPPSVSPNLSDYSLQVRTIMASRYIFNLAQLRSWSASLSSLDHGLQVYLQICSIPASKCIAKLARSSPASSVSHVLEVYLRTRSITACKFTWSWPPSGFGNLGRSRSRSASLSLLNHGLQVYLQIRSNTASKYISKHARSGPWSVSLSSLGRHCHAHLELLSSTACSQCRYTVCRWVAI